ncbi:hypothetical protein BaRGS_00029693, partial [Batillaria attramentaria]
MAPLEHTSSHVAKMAAFAFGVIYFLSSAHAAWVIDAQGARRVDGPVLARIQQQMVASDALTTCASGLDTLVREGATWTERCRNCTCTKDGKKCDGPTCPIPYDFKHELTCGRVRGLKQSDSLCVTFLLPEVQTNTLQFKAKTGGALVERWSSDGCCCQEFGCKLGDGSNTLVPLGAEIPRQPGDPPCRTCKCNNDGTRMCVWQLCDPMACVDPVRVPGQCCPVCPNNHTCVLPMKLRMTMPSAMILEAEPVMEKAPVTLARGTPAEHICFCEQ